MGAFMTEEQEEMLENLTLERTDTVKGAVNHWDHE